MPPETYDTELQRAYATVKDQRDALLRENERLRALLDESAAFWRPVARDLEHNKLSLDSVRFLAQDFLTMLARESGAMSGKEGVA